VGPSKATIGSCHRSYRLTVAGEATRKPLPPPHPAIKQPCASSPFRPCYPAPTVRQVHRYGYYLWVDLDRESMKSYSINLNVCRYETDQTRREACEHEAYIGLRDDRQFRLTDITRLLATCFAGWLVGWLVISIVKWIRRGFVGMLDT
jgi:hypothetical protein